MVETRFAELLRGVCEVLDRLGLVYAVTGSVASSIHGEPYASQDIDFCLHMDESQAAALADGLPSRFYRSKDALTQAASDRTIANIIDNETGLKIDLSVLPDEPFYDSVLSRRQQLAFEPGGSAIWVVSPEDVILMKLIWRRDTRSQKQWDNALSVARAQRGSLDIKYLRRWATAYKIEHDVENLLVEAGA